MNRLSSELKQKGSLTDHIHRASLLQKITLSKHLSGTPLMYPRDIFTGTIRKGKIKGNKEYLCLKK